MPVEGQSTLITPNETFYRIDTALSTPQVDVDTWELTIKGMVDEPYVLNFQQLLEMVEIDESATLACVSNRVGGPLVGNAIWLGVPLPKLLERAGVHEEADQVVGRSVDDFTVGFPTEVALDGRPSMVAIGMNGEPLPAEHGFPARLIIPGLYGYVSATKWLREIELTTFRDFDAYWIPRGWSRFGPIKTQSRIDVPRHRRSIAAGPTEIAGVAWGGIRSIDRVEVQVSPADGPEGEWREAQLGERLTQSSWRQWAIKWDAAPGSYRIAVRATDGNGATQTSSIRPSKPDGATGHHKIDVDVEEA
ncbi:MAG: molybdopterin-dependent oxidoreductase [Chloroflexi bacterium]|nr:molybdopterin-dependent oxidoreductase [Chloroflexota bacterium]